jgi:hypothetical protein
LTALPLTGSVVIVAEIVLVGIDLGIHLDLDELGSFPGHSTTPVVEGADEL